jgi:hypothetical protein
VSELFDILAPPGLAGCSPPFLTALAEPGTVQIWSGLAVRSAADWSLHVRAPANLPMPGGFVAYEGIVETDRWFGPLFTNIRLTRTNTPVVFRGRHAADAGAAVAARHSRRGVAEQHPGPRRNRRFRPR